MVLSYRVLTFGVQLGLYSCSYLLDTYSERVKQTNVHSVSLLLSWNISVVLIDHACFTDMAEVYSDSDSTEFSSDEPIEEKGVLH